MIHVWFSQIYIQENFHACQIHFFFMMAGDADNLNHESDNNSHRNSNADELSDSPGDEDFLPIPEPVNPKVTNVVAQETAVTASRGCGRRHGIACSAVSCIAGHQGSRPRDGYDTAGGCIGRGNRGTWREDGCLKGWLNYSPTKVEHMLKSVWEYLPILGLEWDLVAKCHMQFPPPSRAFRGPVEKKVQQACKS